MESEERKVIDAAVRLLARDGLDGVKPTSQIDIEAGLPVGATDRLFPDEEVLYARIWEALVEVELTNLEPIINAKPGSVRELAELEVGYVDQALARRAEVIEARVAITLRPSAMSWLVRMVTLLVNQVKGHADPGAAIRVITLFRGMTALGVSTGRLPGDMALTDLFAAALAGPPDKSEGWGFTTWEEEGVQGEPTT